MRSYKKSALALIAVLISLIFISCIPSSKITIATIDGEKITKEEFMYFLTAVKMQIEKEQVAELPEDFWETTEIDGKKVIETAKEKALEEAVKSKLSRKKALEAGLKITSQQREEINRTIGELIKKYGTSGVDEHLAQFGLNKALLEKVLEDSAYQQSLAAKMTEDVDEEQAKAYFNEKIARVKHILISVMDKETGQPLETEKLEIAKATAEDMLAKAKSGEDFDSLVAKYSEDPGSASQPDGYYLGKGFVLGSQGAMVPAFETASLELDVGEISDMVESDYGFHIIKKYPNSEAVYNMNSEEILSRAKNNKFEELLESWKNEVKIEKNEKEYSQIKINK